MCYTSLIAGFLFSFYWGWKMTLILLAAFPMLILTGGGLAFLQAGGMKAAMRVYA